MGAADAGKKTRRNPTNPFDRANQAEVYFIEEVLARRIVKGGGVEFLIKWRDYDASQNTWESMLNLTGSESMVREFNDRQKAERERDEELQEQ